MFAHEYWSSSAVVWRQKPTCNCLVAGDESGPRLDRPLGVSSLESLLNEGCEIGRSLWDDTSLLADFDVEYVNFDEPAETIP